ncbi:MAG: fimbria/pilus outer membrane usher protein [Ramlibacter sp.]
MSALLAGSLAWGQTRPDTPVTSPPQDRIVPLDVIVNGDPAGAWAFVDRQGLLYASREALEEWRLRVPPGTRPITVRGVEYWPLSAIPGYAAKPNYVNQSVELTFAPDAFDATKVSAPRTERPRISPVLPSLFANYELNYNRASGSGTPATSELGALVEVGGSTDLGLLTTSYVGHNLVGTDSANSHWTRLETTFTRNLPDEQRTLRLGDAATRVGMWGRNVYFGGVQFGTNYALTPGFLTQPIPIVRGVSAAPSTVELYVNGVLRQVTQVPAGPFAVDNAAALTGGGEARLVVRDILGREVVITQPFFTSSSLLTAGLSDWSVEAGAVRHDLGTTSASYGPGFTSATWRYGVSNDLTTEARSELSRSVQTAGLGLVGLLPLNVLGRMALSASTQDRAGSGRQWLVGFEKQWFKTVMQGQVQVATQDYRTLGQPEQAQVSKLQAGFNMSHTTSQYGTFGFAAVRTEPWDSPALSTVSLNYTTRIFGQSSLTTTISRAIGAGQGTAVGFSVLVPLENNRQVTALAQRRGRLNDSYATATKTANLDTQWGWRVLGGELNSQRHAEGGLYYQGRHGNVYTELSGSQDQAALRTGASGALVLAGGSLFSTRRIEQSYALVEVKDFADVGVGIGNNMLTRTDDQGRALLVNLNPYVANQIRLNPQDLPVSAEIDSIEDIVVPPLRSAVKLAFPVRGGRSALLRIGLDDGEPAPAGAVVRIEGDAKEFWVARKGEAYVTGITPSSRLEMEWSGQHCSLQVPLPPASRDAIPRVTTLCRGVHR